MKPFQFVQLADIQFGLFADSSGKTSDEILNFARKGLMVRAARTISGYEAEIELFTGAALAINSIEPRFAVMCGDIANRPGNVDEFLAARKIAEQVNSNTRFHWVPGNHDIASDFNRPEHNLLTSYRNMFGSDYYQFRVDEALFIAINSTVLNSPTSIPGEADAQIEFVSRGLNDARERGVHVVGVFSHHPPFLDTPDEPDSPWNISQPYRGLLLDLLFRYEVSAVFAGHWHRNHVVKHQTLEVVCSGPVGYPLGDDPSGYRVVDVTDDGFSHRYIPLAPSPDNRAIREALSH